MKRLRSVSVDDPGPVDPVLSTLGSSGRSDRRQEIKCNGCLTIRRARFAISTRVAHGRISTSSAIQAKTRRARRVYDRLALGPPSVRVVEANATTCGFANPTRMIADPKGPVGDLLTYVEGTVIVAGRCKLKEVSEWGACCAPPATNPP